MHVDIMPTMRIDTNLLTEQQALLANLITNLSCGRTGISIMRDKDALLGIRGILDAIADSVDDAIELDDLDDYSVPECPGCTEPGNCDDCEYTSDPDVDPVCERR
jgi:hypothetical protein